MAASKTSLFVMTTREHILRQALAFYEELKRENVDARRYLLELDEYSRLDKARIFYNHIWASGQLDQRAAESLVAGKGYARIIDHAEYNPRLIEYITGLGSLRLGEEEKANFVDFAVGILDDPEQIWRQAFENQLDPAERSILVVLASMQTQVVVEDLEAGFRSFCAAAGIGVRGPRFRRSLRVLEDSFASSTPHRDSSLIQPANPSIADFISAWLLASPDEAIAACDGAVFFAQLEWLGRSLLPKVKGAFRKELLEHMAIAVMRLFDSDDPRWHYVHIGGALSVPSLSRMESEPSSRLIFILSLFENAPELESTLGNWFEEQLEKESMSWGSRHVPNAAEPVAVVRAVRSANRQSGEVAKRAKGHLIGRLRSTYAWEQLVALREIEPDLFPANEWVGFQNQFLDFADDFTSGYDEIEEVEEVERLEALAGKFGVDLEPFDIEFVREEIRRAVAKQENAAAEMDEDRERPSRASFDRTAEQIDALFGRLQTR